MRLTCPNCAAQYEIDASLIPRDGREVQCSNCSQTWFVRKTGMPEGVPSGNVPFSQPDDTPARREPAPAPQEPASTPEDVPSTPVADPDARGPSEPEGEDAALPRRRELDERTRTILREEAEREAEQRRRAARDATVRVPARRESEAPHPAPATPEAGPAPAPRAAPPRPPQDERPLPDADRISSTLTATPERRETSPPSAPRGDDAQGHRDAAPADAPRGFGRGFAIVLILAALLALLYVGAPALARAVPGLEPQIAAYVDGVNALRGGLDRWLDALASLFGG